MSFFADLLAKIGAGFAGTSESACSFLFIDEPKMPKSLIEK